MSNTTLGGLTIVFVIVLSFAFFQKDIMKLIKGEDGDTVHFSSTTTFSGDGKGGVAVKTKGQSSGDFKMPKVDMGKCKHIPKMLRKCRSFSCEYMSVMPLFGFDTYISREISGMKNGKCEFEEVTKNMKKKPTHKLTCLFPKRDLRKVSLELKNDTWTPEFGIFVDKHTYPMSDICTKYKFKKGEWQED